MAPDGLQTAAGREIHQDGVFVATFTAKGNVHEAVVAVSRDTEGLYLSLDACKGLSLVHEDFPVFCIDRSGENATWASRAPS